MFETLPKTIINAEREREGKLQTLLHKAKQGPDALSAEERKNLQNIGYEYIRVAGQEKPWCAVNAFRSLHDFDGLRATLDYCLRHEPETMSIPDILVALEDYAGQRLWLNRTTEIVKLNYNACFKELDRPLYTYIAQTLKDNETPEATGGFHTGSDLIALHHLSRKYDVGIPIARGGLYQGAIAQLWGMPTHTADVSAHGRKRPTGKWIRPVSAEDIQGKHILLFDKDAVTGASIRKTMAMLEKFKPAHIGAYFTWPILQPGQFGVGTLTEGLPNTIDLYSAEDIYLHHAGDVYFKAHEKLHTLYGQRRRVEQEYRQQYIPRFAAEHSDIEKALKSFLQRSLRVYDNLNPFLAGVPTIREKLLNRLRSMARAIEQYHAPILNIPGTKERLLTMITNTPALFPGELENAILLSRYHPRAQRCAEERGIENPHVPSSPLAAHYTAAVAMKEGIDYALIVGPEGFAYEPYFRELGIPTLAVNIPESAPEEPRTLRNLDNLSILKGKKVLIVEDDIQTGATLEKLLEQLKEYAPAQMNLYLGQPERFQKKQNIPTAVTKTYIAGEGASEKAQAAAFRAFLLSRGLRMFKTDKA